jgi:hypothetical protein
VPAFEREGYLWSEFRIRDLAGTPTYPDFWSMAGNTGAREPQRFTALSANDGL